MGRRDRPRLNRATLIRRRAGRVMRAERLAAAVAPAATILLAYLVVALFGLGTPWLFAASLAIAGIALGLGTATCRWPQALEIDRRIEAASALQHQPFAALDDRLESTNPLTIALWQAHQNRAALAIAGAHPGWPALPGVAQDRFALRALLLLLLLTAAVAAGTDAPARLTGAFTLPGWPLHGPQVDVWITPPDYANAPPRPLSSGATLDTLPGSHLTVIVNGPNRLPFLRFGHTAFAATALSHTSHRADALITASGRLVIGPWWHRLTQGRITVVPPLAPLLALTTMEVSADGHVYLGWHVDDPYGLASLNAQIAPIADPQALPQVYALPTGLGDAAARLNLSSDPLAGLLSHLILRATNRAGVSIQLNAPQNFTPPLPSLTNVTSIALFNLRQNLALSPEDGATTAAALRRLAVAPPSIISDSVDVQLAALAGALAQNHNTATQTVERLGQLIQQIEQGPDYQPAQALLRADQALLRALQNGLHTTPADLNKLLEAVHQALSQHLAALQSAAPPTSRQLDLSTLDRLARQIAADQAAGRTAQATQELRALQSALSALQAARPMTAAQAAKAQAATAAAASLAKLTTGEAALRDQTYRGGGTPNQQKDVQSGLAAVQKSLDQAGIPTRGLGPAAGAMDAARQALSQFDDAKAEAAETGAIQNLQKAAASLNAAAQQNLSASQGGLQPGEGENGDGGGIDEDPSGFSLPAANPADAIQQQIIRDDANPSLPEPTHQYLRRLLNTDQP